MERMVLYLVLRHNHVSVTSDQVNDIQTCSLICLVVVVVTAPVFPMYSQFENFYDTVPSCQNQQDTGRKSSEAPEDGPVSFVSLTLDNILNFKNTPPVPPQQIKHKCLLQLAAKAEWPTICHPSSRDLTPFSDLLGLQAGNWCTDIHAGKTPRHRKLKLTKIWPHMALQFCPLHRFAGLIFNKLGDEKNFPYQITYVNLLETTCWN